MLASPKQTAAFNHFIDQSNQSGRASGEQDFEQIEFLQEMKLDRSDYDVDENG